MSGKHLSTISQSVFILNMASSSAYKNLQY